MFRWNGGSASFRKKLLRKMPDKNNKATVSKYFSKNQASKKCDTNYQLEDKVDYCPLNIDHINYSIAYQTSKNNQFCDKKNISSSKKDTNEYNIKIMIDPSEFELYPLNFNKTDILLVDPDFMKVASSQKENQDNSLTCINQNQIIMNNDPQFVSTLELKSEFGGDPLKDKTNNENVKIINRFNNQFKISNQTIFNRIIELRDIQTQTT